VLGAQYEAAPIDDETTQDAAEVPRQVLDGSLDRTPIDQNQVAAEVAPEKEAAAQNDDQEAAHPEHMTPQPSDASAKLQGHEPSEANMEPALALDEADPHPVASDLALVAEPGEPDAGGEERDEGKIAEEMEVEIEGGTEDESEEESEEMHDDEREPEEGIEGQAGKASRMPEEQQEEEYQSTDRGSVPIEVDDEEGKAGSAVEARDRTSSDGAVLKDGEIQQLSESSEPLLEMHLIM
jgi:hypothetical protein